MEPWSFIENPFLNATDSSFRRSVKISHLHLAALQAMSAEDPEIAEMAIIFDPVNETLNSAYDSHKAQQGAQEGDTLSVNQQLRLLSNPKIRLWDIRIQNVYASDTAKYKALLPQHRKPFQTGAQLSRINAVNTLAMAMGTDPLLASLKTEINTFYTQINTAYSSQQGAITSTRSLSDDVEDARVAMCIAMYRNLGKLMAKFAGKPTDIVKFFPLDLIRKAQQVDFTSSVKPHTVSFIVKRTLSESDKVKLINDGDATLRFYLGDSKTAMPGSEFVEITPKKETTVDATALGTLENPFLLCYNAETQAGHFTLELG